MMQFPLRFEARTESQSGIQSRWQAQCGQHTTALAIPPEFEGPGQAFSPEDLFNQALCNCFLATFKVYAEKSKVDYDRVTVESVLEVDLDDNKKPVMKRVFVKARIHGPSHPERALVLAKKASEAGFILNSVKTEKNFDIQCV